VTGAPSNQLHIQYGIIIYKKKRGKLPYRQFIVHSRIVIYC